MKKMKKLTLARGFTLLETIIVLFIISLLLLLILPNLSRQRQNATKVSDEAFEQVLVTQAELYNSEHNDGSFTVSIDELSKEKYLTDKQLKRAKGLGITQVTEDGVQKGKNMTNNDA